MGWTPRSLRTKAVLSSLVWFGFTVLMSARTVHFRPWWVGTGIPGWAAKGTSGRRGGAVTDANDGTEDATESPRLGLGRPELAVVLVLVLVLVVRVTAPIHLGGSRGGKPGRRMAREPAAAAAAAAAGAPPPGWDTDGAARREDGDGSLSRDSREA